MRWEAFRDRTEHKSFVLQQHSEPSGPRSLHDPKSVVDVKRLMDKLLARKILNLKEVLIHHHLVFKQLEHTVYDINCTDCVAL